MKRSRHLSNVGFRIEALQSRQLLAAASVPIPLNPVNQRPITDPDYTLIPVPRINITKKQTLVVTAPNSSDRININMVTIDGVNRIVVTVNDRQRIVPNKSVRRVQVVADGGLDDPNFFPQRGADEIDVTGDTAIISTRRVSIFGDNIAPAEAQGFDLDGADTITGTAFADVISAGGGRNFVEASGGNDSITSGPGNDTVGAGSGNDTVSTGNGLDEITGGNGNDSISAGDGSDNVFGGEGNDNIDLGFSVTPNVVDFADGGNGNDSVLGSIDRDIIFLGDGDDTCNTRSGNDSILGGPGNDRITAGTGNDTAYGEDGNDSIFGDAENTPFLTSEFTERPLDDSIFGNAGDDYLWGESGDDTVSGGSGADTLLGQYGTDHLSGGDGPDYLNGHEGNDDVSGGKGRDTYNRADLEARAEPDFEAGQTDFRTSQDNPNLDVRKYRLSFQIDDLDSTKETQGPFTIT